MPTFLARRDYIGLLSNWVQVADTNGDGIPDLIASWQGISEVLFGNGDGTFRSGPSQMLIGSSYSFVATDLNGDGMADLVLVDGAAIAVCLGNGDGTFQNPAVYPTANDGLFHMVVGDFNGDGIPDVATAGPTASGCLLARETGHSTPVSWPSRCLRYSPASSPRPTSIETATWTWW